MLCLPFQKKNTHPICFSTCTGEYTIHPIIVLIQVSKHQLLLINNKRVYLDQFMGFLWGAPLACCRAPWGSSRCQWQGLHQCMNTAALPTAWWSSNNDTYDRKNIQNIQNNEKCLLLWKLCHSDTEIICWKPIPTILIQTREVILVVFLTFVLKVTSFLIDNVLIKQTIMLVPSGKESCWLEVNHL